MLKEADPHTQIRDTMRRLCRQFPDEHFRKIDEQRGCPEPFAEALARASWEAANVCLQTDGGFGFACECDIEPKFRETRLHPVAPISTQMIFSCVAEHVLGLPKSY